MHCLLNMHLFLCTVIDLWKERNKNDLKIKNVFKVDVLGPINRKLISLHTFEKSACEKVASDLVIGNCLGQTSYHWLITTQFSCKCVENLTIKYDPSYKLI